MVGPYRREDQPELSGACWLTVAEFGVQKYEKGAILKQCHASRLPKSLHTPGCMGGMCLAEHPQGPLHEGWQLRSCASTRQHLCNEGKLHSPAMALLDRQGQIVSACCAADIISAIEFDASGQHLATGDRGGRVVLFERVAIQNVRLTASSYSGVPPAHAAALAVQASLLHKEWFPATKLCCPVHMRT